MEEELISLQQFVADQNKKKKKKNRKGNKRDKTTRSEKHCNRNDVWMTGNLKFASKKGQGMTCTVLAVIHADTLSSWGRCCCHLKALLRSRDAILDFIQRLRIWLSA